LAWSRSLGGDIYVAPLRGLSRSVARSRSRPWSRSLGREIYVAPSRGLSRSVARSRSWLGRAVSVARSTSRSRAVFRVRLRGLRGRSRGLFAVSRAVAVRHGAGHGRGLTTSQ
jgi:hypothetical protein